MQITLTVSWATEEKDVELEVTGCYDKGFPGSYMEPPESESFEIDSVEPSDVVNLEDESQLRMILDLCFDKIRSRNEEREED